MSNKKVFESRDSVKKILVVICASMEILNHQRCMEDIIPRGCERNISLVQQIIFVLLQLNVNVDIRIFAG